MFHGEREVLRQAYGCNTPLKKQDNYARVIGFISLRSIHSTSQNYDISWPFLDNDLNLLKRRRNCLFSMHLSIKQNAKHISKCNLVYWIKQKQQVFSTKK